MYRNILAAIELAEQPARAVLEHARNFLAAGGVLRVVHVVEPQYVQYSFDPTFKGSVTDSLKQGALDAAGARLAELCEPYGIGAEHRYAVLGRSADRIQELAQEQACDLIVIGSHGQGGLRRLLGSTANAVLHGAPTDVATVRIQSEPGS